MTDRPNLVFKDLPHDKQNLLLAMPPDMQDAFMERTAICIFEGGMTPKEASDIAWEEVKGMRNERRNNTADT